MTKLKNYVVKLTKPNFKKLHQKFDNAVKHMIDQPKNAYAAASVARLKDKLLGYKHDDAVNTILAKYELA